MAEAQLSNQKLHNIMKAIHICCRIDSQSIACQFPTGHGPDRPYGCTKGM